MNNKYGFYISKLQVSGLNIKPARLSFSRGFNIISGLSDTGKSYIFGCINFMLGGGDLPKEIPEGFGYTTVCLEIKTYNERTYTLERNLKGGNYKLKEVELELFQTRGNSQELKAQHTSNSHDNISSFLLGLSGFKEKFVKKNQSNAKRELSFRDIAKLTLIDEERIITEKSPVYSSGQYIDQTQEQSVLEILLTGNDAKELEQVEDAKVYASRVKGKVEFVDSLIKELSEKLIVLEKDNNLEKQKLLQTKVDSLSIVLSESSSKLEQLTSEKQLIFNSLNELKSKDLLQEELTSRFILLKEHYNSDIKRLEFITEGEEYFAQLNTIKCPLCGGDMDKEHYDCIVEDGKKVSSVINSIEIEVAKIKIKLSDLESTMSQLAQEKEERNSQLKKLERQYKIVEIEIATNIEPVKASTKQEIESLIGELSLLKELDVLKEQLKSYYNQKSLLEIELARKPKTGEQSDGIKYSIFSGLCEIIEDILKKWKYPNISNVNFDPSYRVYDIVINGKQRKAHGKGIRAITYTSFIIGLMDFCIKNNLPHSRNVIIDSPLTTYHGKESDSKEDVSRDMQDAFFNDLSNVEHNKQIIIFDNKDPKESLKSKINYIHFTGDKQRGRQGFFPM